MNGSEILAALRQELASRIQQYETSPPTGLAVSPWLNMSVMQKAIRRADRDRALGAAASLLAQSPDRFWRRAALIAFEDIGAADITVVGLVIASLGGKGFRSHLGGEWKVASFIVEEMVKATKCRAADDLIMISERHPAWEQARLSLTYRRFPDLIKIAFSNGDLPTRALALWYAIGTARCPSEHLRSRTGSPQATFDALCEAGVPRTIAEIAREGFSKTGSMLCPLLPLLASSAPYEPRSLVDDVLPPEATCGDLPGWALDMFTREGRRALKLFLEADARTSRWIKRNVPSDRQLDFIGFILFAAESGLLKRRLVWPLGRDLRHLAEIESQGRECPDASDIIDTMRNEIPLLNEVRAHVF